MKLSVIIPVHNGGSDFRLCMEALKKSDRTPNEIIVVDDVSTDGTAEVASQYTVRVIRTGAQPRGPAFARNLGAKKSKGDLFVFLDTDVAVHKNTLSEIEKEFHKEPKMAALFGSYDDQPIDRGVVSRYKNLLHHYVHQHGKRDASTFWAGCGAVRRDVFWALDGFDENFLIPAIEDIELGDRMKRAGYTICLNPDIQVTHLKRWTFLNLLYVDIFCRAIPWTRLILQRGQIPNDLNVNVKNRWSAGILWAMLFSMAGSLIIRSVFWLALANFFILLLLNRDLYQFFIRKGGLAFGITSLLLHLLYLMYSSLVFLILKVHSLIRGH